MNDTTLETRTVWEALASIPDPEFGINLVDLGLIYSAECADGHVSVVMTLTTPTCPSGSWMHQGVREVVAKLDGVKSVQVDLVFEPPWSPAMLSATARRQLGCEKTD